MLKRIISTLLLLALLPVSNICMAKEEIKYITVKANEDVHFEAEDYAVINRNYAIGNDTVAYPGNDSEYLYIPLTVDANLGFNLEGEPEHYYNLDVQEDGMYNVWIHLYSRDSGTRAFNYNFDGATFALREAEYDPPAWRWMLMGSKFLAKGKHTMGFIHRHKLTPIDKFIITTEPDFNPDGEPVSKPEFLPQTGESAQLYYNLPPIVPPSGVHPRLLLNDEVIEEIKKNLNHEQNAKVYQNVLNRAKTETDGNFPPMMGTSQTNISNEVSDVILSCAFLYALHGDKEYGKKAISIAKNALVTAEGKGQGVDAYTRSGGHLMFVTACMYDWCYDLMSDQEREFLRKYMYKIATFMEIGYPVTHPGNIHGHNLEMQVWKDMMAMAIAIYDEDPKMYNNIGGRVFDQMIPVRNELNKSIFFSEGPTYGPLRFNTGLFTAFYLRAMGYDNVFGEQQKNTVYGQFYRRRPDGRMLHNSDDANEDMYGYTTGGGGEYIFIGNFYNDPFVKREYYKNIRYGNSSTTDVLGPGSVMHLIINNVSIPVDQTDTELPHTAYSDDGVMVARTSWDMGMDSDTVLVQMNTKERFYGMHDHMDAGHFDIYYKGSLAIDSGVYESDPFVDQDGNLISSNLTHGSKHWYGYSRRAIAHNVMLVEDPSETVYEMYNKIYINDGGQKDKSALGGNYEDLESYNAGEMLSADFGPDLHTPAYSYLKGDLKGAYTDKIKEYERTFMFLNFFDDKYPAALLVLDNVESSNADFKKKWVLHSQEEPTVSDNTTTIKRTELGYNGRLVNETLLPEKVSITKIGGDGHEFEYNGYNYGAQPKTRTQEAGKWRIEISPSASSKEDCFLNVMQMSENDDNIAPLEPEIIRNDSYVGVKIKDRAVFLKKEQKLTIADTKVSAKGDGSIMYIIDGMREGRWNVYDENNKKLTDCIVEKEHNVVSFEAPEGEYTLKWEYMSKIPEKDYSIKANTIKTEPGVADVQIDRIFETFKNKPVIKNNELYLPIEELFDKLNKEYICENGIYTIDAAEKVIIDTNNGTVTRNAEVFEFKNKPEATEKGIYIPVRELCEAMKYSYEWDKLAKIAYISSGEDIVTKLKLLNSDDPDRIRVRQATCSSAPYSSPYDTVDGNIGSYWGGQGDGEWIMYEFEEESEIAAVDIKWHVGDQRSAKFDILISADGENWTTVYEGQSSGNSKTFERVAISADGKYSFVKILGHGNSVNDWNSVSEVRLYNTTE